MSQDLKDFINQHRDQFDDEYPPANGWRNIESRLTPAPPVRNLAWVKWAAAAVIFLACSIGLVIGTRRDPQPADERSVAAGSVSDHSWPQEYAGLARTYASLIEQRQQQLRQAAAGEPQLMDQFTQDLATLDSSYQILYRQASNSPASDVILRAMIQNLQLQAELLSKQLDIINTYFNQTKYSHEKSNSRSI